MDFEHVRLQILAQDGSIGGADKPTALGLVALAESIQKFGIALMAATGSMTIEEARAAWGLTAKEKADEHHGS